MMTTDVYPGKDLRTLELTITDEMVQHYVKGLDEPNPWYTATSPFGGPVAPVIVYQTRTVSSRAGTSTTSSATCGGVKNGRSMFRRAPDRPCAAARGWRIATGGAIATSSRRRCGCATRPAN